MNKKLIIMAACMTALFSSTAFMSCDNDHFNIDPLVSGEGSLWQNISANPDLSEFASILSRVYYSKSEKETTDRTYADMLGSDQTFTLWAPKNGTFEFEKWDEMLKSGDREQIWKVENELIRNCMTRYRHVLNGDKKEDIYLFNGKVADFDCGQRTINETDIIEANIGSGNGIIHMTDGSINYLNNMYEYINNHESLTKLSAFFRKFDKTVFSESASTQGPTIDGEITWVDSVTFLSNSYFNPFYLDAYINREDSNYVMVLPTDDLWDTEYEKMKSYFHYLPTYNQTVVTVAADGTSSSDVLTTKFTDQEIDSITDFRTCDAIARNLCFNANYQYGHDYKEMATEGACDSIQSTSGIIFYDPNSAALFNHVTPVRVSNGWAYVVDQFNYKMEDTWLKERKLEAEMMFESYDYCSIASYNLNNIGNPWNYLSAEEVAKLGPDFVKPDSLMEGRAIRIIPTRTTANPTVKFRLPNTLSCKYDIIAILPYNTSAGKPYQLRAYLNYHSTKANQDRIQLKPIEGVNGTGNYFRTKTPHVDEKGYLQFSDSLLLCSDYKFPVSYYGIQDAYVTLELNSYLLTSQRNTYTNEFFVDKIILIPKENE